MDHFVDARDYRLLEGDPYTFFVLRRIMGGECRLLLTDHAHLILCLTCPPFPVWIWTSDDAGDDALEAAYQLAKAEGLLDGGHRFNLKYPLAEAFIRLAAAEGRSLAIVTNMLAYDCPSPVAPSRPAPGGIHRCGPEDLEALVDFMDLFHREIGIDQKRPSEYRADARAMIDAGHTFFWRDERGANVASCKYEPTDDMASINLVFTHPDHRRRHYAENLVYQVTLLAKQAGYLPMLYTDADYAASNACYEKIGYVPRGRLCTLAEV